MAERSYVVTFGLTIALVVAETDEAARRKIRQRYTHFTVGDNEIFVRVACDADRQLVEDHPFTNTRAQKRWLKLIGGDT